MKQENNNLNIEKFLVIFLSFLCEYDCYELDMDVFKSYIEQCINSDEYSQLFKCFNGENILKYIDIKISELVAERILKKVDVNKYEIMDDASSLDIGYNNISSFIQKMIDFVDNYYEMYLNNENEDDIISNEKIRYIDKK